MSKSKYRVAPIKGRFKVQRKSFLCWCNDGLQHYCGALVTYRTKEGAEEFIDKLILLREESREDEIRHKMHAIQNPPYEYP
jgi:hypothetical protein